MSRTRKSRQLDYAIADRKFDVDTDGEENCYLVGAGAKSNGNVAEFRQVNRFYGGSRVYYLDSLGSMQELAAIQLELARAQKSDSLIDGL